MARWKLQNAWEQTLTEYSKLLEPQISLSEEDDNVRRLCIYEVTIVDMQSECIIFTDRLIAGSRDEAIVKSNVGEKIRGMSFDDIKLVVEGVEELGPKPQKLMDY